MANTPTTCGKKESIEKYKAVGKVLWMDVRCALRAPRKATR